ncbi:hypothetical protein PIROE2DRAFT_2960, partial [Piromyces sp. E2]
MDEDTEAVVFQSLFPNKIILKDTIFENIISKHFGFNTRLSLDIINSKFINNYSMSGFLFYTQDFVYVENSFFSNTTTLFKGSKCKYEIVDTIFENFYIDTNIPVIIDSRFASINITNSEFNNFKMMGSLFYEETKINLHNIKLNNVSTNSKGVIYSTFNNVQIDGLYAQDIICYGESGDSSIILFDSNTEIKELKINNINISNSFTNGPAIKITGISNEIYINNLNISNVKSYGPIIDNISYKTISSFSNINLNNNINSDRLECGNIHLQNDVTFYLNNSNFIGNINKGNGGV